MRLKYASDLKGLHFVSVSMSLLSMIKYTIVLYICQAFSVMTAWCAATDGLAGCWAKPSSRRSASGARLSAEICYLVRQLGGRHGGGSRFSILGALLDSHVYYNIRLCQPKVKPFSLMSSSDVYTWLHLATPEMLAFCVRHNWFKRLDKEL